MNGSPLFSVIVPCCDVAPYVGECIESVRRQGASFEAIVVVEESRDATERAVREAVAGDSRFSVIVEPRSGSPSTPRNTGLAAAKGDYIVFLDGDDTLAEGALEDIAAFIERYPGVDLLPGAVVEGEKVYDNYPCDLAKLPMTGVEAGLCVARHNVEPMPMAQMTVCRRAFLLGHALRFVDGLRHEDEEFPPRALYLAAGVVPTHLKFYLYRRRADSITTARKERNLSDIAIVYRSLFRFHAEVKPAAEVSRGWARNWLNTFFNAFFFPARSSVRVSEHRASALKALFAEGFGDFDRLVRHASKAKRIGAALMRFAVRTGWYAPADFYFSRVYYPLAMRRSSGR